MAGAARRGEPAPRRGPPSVTVHGGSLEPPAMSPGLRALLQDIHASSGSGGGGPSPGPASGRSGPPRPPFAPGGPPPPPSALLDRLKDFMPKMDRANRDLQAVLAACPSGAASGIEIEEVLDEPSLFDGTGAGLRLPAAGPGAPARGLRAPAGGTWQEAACSSGGGESEDDSEGEEEGAEAGPASARQQPHVEMDVSLGVLELRSPAALAMAERAVGGDWATAEGGSGGGRGGGRGGAAAGGAGKKGAASKEPKRPKIEML